MQKINQFLIILTGLLLISCDYVPDYRGEMNELIIFCSPEDREGIQPALDSLFSQAISTPQPESILNISWADPWDFNDYQLRPNLLVVSLLKPEDTTGDRLYTRFDEQFPSREGIILANDLYAKDQAVIAIQGIDAIELQLRIDKYGQWIMNQLTEELHQRVLKYALSKGLNKQLMSQVKSDFGIELPIQRDFMEIRNEPESEFLWIGRGFPYRWITFHKTRNGFENPDSSWLDIKVILEESIGSIEIPDMLSETQIQELQGKKVRMVRGVYYHEESNSGGPFFTCILSPPGEESHILVSGFVNYPGHDKLLLIKQLETLILEYEFINS